MAGYGIPYPDIGTVVGISHVTLAKHYRKELDTGHVLANSKVAESLYKQATGGNVTAAIWWTKARMGWSETMQHAGPDGGPIEVSDVSTMQAARLILAALREAKENQE